MDFGNANVDEYWHKYKYYKEETPHIIWEQQKCQKFNLKKLWSIEDWLSDYMKFESAVWWTIIDGGWKVEELGEHNVGDEHGKTTL